MPQASKDVSVLSSSVSCPLPRNQQRTPYYLILEMCSIGPAGKVTSWHCIPLAYVLFIWEFFDLTWNGIRPSQASVIAVRLTTRQVVPGAKEFIIII